MLIKKRQLVCVIPFAVFTAEQLLAQYIMRKYSFSVRGDELEIIWTEMLCGDGATVLYAPILYGSIGGILAVTVLIYVLRGHRYECL